MKQGKLKKIVDKRISGIQQSSRKIIAGRKNDDVHGFRVAFKKYRAFVRLLDEPKNDKEISLPLKLKRFYRYAGALRDKQLYCEQMNSKSGISNPGFTKALPLEIKTRRKILIRHIHDFSFQKFREAAENKLPEKVTAKSIGKYFRKKINKIDKLSSNIDTDESIHSVRKCMKDLLYNAKALKHFRVARAVLEKEKKYEGIMEMIGSYNDVRISLSFLRKDISKNSNSKEELQFVKNELLKKKGQLKKEILRSLAQ